SGKTVLLDGLAVEESPDPNAMDRKGVGSRRGRHHRASRRSTEGARRRTNAPWIGTPRDLIRTRARPAFFRSNEPFALPQTASDTEADSCGSCPTSRGAFAARLRTLSSRWRPGVPGRSASKIFG